MGGNRVVSTGSNVLATRAGVGTILGSARVKAEGTRVNVRRATPWAALRFNKSIDTDVLSADFARLLAAGHLRRQPPHRKHPPNAIHSSM